MIKNLFKVAIDESGKLKSDYIDESDLAWRNIKEGARIHNLGFVVSGSNGWLRANPGKNLQDLEGELRKHKVPVHLVASTDIQTMHEGKELLLKPLFDNSLKPKYQLIYSCKPDDLAVEEINRFWKSYQENYNKLTEAGLLYIKKDDETSENLKPFFSETPDTITIKGLEAVRDGNQLQAMSYNCVELQCKMLTQIDLKSDLDNDIANAKQTLKKEPEEKIIDTSHTDRVITAFTVDGKLVSSLGVLSKKDGTEKKIVCLEDQNSWRWEDEEDKN